MTARALSLTVPERPEGTAPGLRAQVRVTVDGEPVELDVSMPAGPLRLAELLPVLHELCDLMARLGRERAEREGRGVSCAKGCGACCRQPVPVTESEAAALTELVAALPEPRRRELRARFAEALGRIEPSGLLELLRRPEELDRATLSAAGHAYFSLGVPCPFLEDESCSIHAVRPLACREFLVSSPAVACSTPESGAVRTVTLPAQVFRAAQALDARGGGAGWTTLVLALEPRAPHAERPGLEWLKELFSELGTIKGPLPAALGLSQR